MHRNQSRGPQRPTINQDVKQQLDEIRTQLDRMEWKIGRSYQGINKSIDELGEDTMADFTALNAKVTNITDIATAIKTMYDGVIVERDAAKAEVDRLNAADASDQGSVDAAAAKLSEAEAVLAALTAVGAGTPVDPTTGGSTGGVGGSTGGV